MRTLFALTVASVLAACSNAEQAASGDAASGEPSQAGTVAYGFTYRFALPHGVVDRAQERHIALCDQLGPTRCRMLEMHRSAAAGGLDGSARFTVAAGDARRFGEALIGSIAPLGGELASRDFEAQDLAAERGDAQARVAEKNSVANRATLSAVQERLRMSTVRTYYEGTASFGDRIGGALGAVGETLTTSIVMLIYFLAGALPWAFALSAILLILRAGVRWVRRGRAPAAAESATTAPSLFTGEPV